MLAVPRRIGGQPVGPLVVFHAGRRNTLKGGQTVQRDADGLGKAVEQSLIDKEHLGRLGEGKDIEPPVVQPPLLHEAGQIGVQLLLGKRSIQRRQQLLCPQNGGRGGVTGGNIRHLGRAGVPGGDHGQLLLDGGRAGDRGDAEYDAVFLAHRTIELVHQGVHGGLHLSAEIVPQGQSHRMFGVQSGRLTASG